MDRTSVLIIVMLRKNKTKISQAPGKVGVMIRVIAWVNYCEIKVYLSLVEFL